MNDEEIVCGCFNVSVGDVKKAIEEGATSFEAVQKATQLGTGCQGCVEDAKKLVESLLALK